ncbi:hypothetical protein HNE_3467 [Hyphomonas neptunium ATCC 15444]|uniref:Uncharacterized protein n=2 Tax=Hyphomonas TaxID=85 RepID=Q0BWK4_HYPNA|nr:hypothetical protein HNE_3467 [Hyphomonas neptunium ATCC 15444]KCZ94715.1 hypothetical protein HHI_07968 [Hyphomonas hirschiana VP5]
MRFDSASAKSGATSSSGRPSSSATTRASTRAGSNPSASRAPSSAALSLCVVPAICARAASTSPARNNISAATIRPARKAARSATAQLRNCSALSVSRVSGLAASGPGLPVSGRPGWPSHATAVTSSPAPAASFRIPRIMCASSPLSGVKASRKPLLYKCP